MDWAIRTIDEGVVADGLEAVNRAEPWALIERFAELRRDSASQDERRAAEYIADRLESFGLEPTVHDPSLYLSVPRSCSLEIDDGGWQRIDCKVPAYASSTPAAGLEGELVGVAADEIQSMEALFRAGARIDPGVVAGKIVVVDGYAMPKIVGEIESAGARAAIFVNPANSHEGIITRIWGTPGLRDRGRIPDFVVVSVSRADGERLREAADRGAQRARLHTDLFQGWARCPLVTVDIPGRTDAFTLLHGHYDSWHVGIGDNAVGNAALLEVARVAGACAGRLERGIRVAWWPAHSTGRYAGSTWYADAHAIELRDRCVAQINVDSPGCRWATRYDHVMWMAEAEGIARYAIRRGADSEARGIRPLRAGDYSFNGIGLTGFFMLLSNIPAELAKDKGFYPCGGCGGNSDAWHTEADTIDVADPDNLVRDIRVYVASVLGLATAALPPFDYRAAAREILATARAYAEATGGAFDIEPVTEAGEQLVGRLDSMYARAEEELGTGGAECDSDALEKAQRRLARALVPINYTAAPAYAHDPATEVPAVPDLAVLGQWDGLEGDEDGRGFLLTQALRGRNRVVDALRRAAEAVAD